MTLTLAIANANANKTDDWVDTLNLNTIVAGWIQYEMSKVGLELIHPNEADVVFLVHSGEVDYRHHCQEALKQIGIQWQANKRNHMPYIITGGAVDTSPFVALEIADALAVGEAYTFMRELLRIVKNNGDLTDVRNFIIGYPHAIERNQIEGFERDSANPHLLKEAPPILASPDSYIDWGDMPSFEGGDGVLRATASKGCHLKCSFCATTYRQVYQVSDNVDGLVQQMMEAKAQKRGISLVTNDAAALPFYQQIVDAKQLQFQSVTIKALRDPKIRADVMAGTQKLIRTGVEGLSEQTRKAYGKPVSNWELVQIVKDFQTHKKNFRLFFIGGAPYESDDDWQNFAYLMDELAQVVQWGRSQIKITAFNPQPPTPLVYFIPSIEYQRRYELFYANYKLRNDNVHINFMQPRVPKTRIRDIAHAFSVSLHVATEWAYSQGTLDLAPTLGHALRFPHEMIEWYLPAEKRWRLSRSYMKRMGVEAPEERVGVTND